MPTDTPPADEHPASPTDLPPWMDADDDWDEGEDGGRGLGRGRLLAVAAAVPWVLALVLLLRTGDQGDPPTADPAPLAAVSPTPAVEGTPGAEDRGGTATTPPPLATANRPRTTVTAADAVAMATAVARAWITGVGPRLAVDGVPGPPSLYAEHLVAEAIDHPSPGFAVVTLLGVVLEVDGGDYRAASVRRLAVPVALDADGAHPAGSPWWLPAPDLSPTAITATGDVDDPDLMVEAAAAAAAAGYRDVELIDLATTGSWPLIATLRAIAPGQDGGDEHEVWLRPHLDGLVVAGWLPDRPDPAATEDQP